jgi:hypothetical protein
MVSELPRFRPTEGELHGHVFENPRAGVPRGLYWSLRCDFEPVEVNGSEWSVSLMVEWLTFDIRRWVDLDTAGVAVDERRDGVEASVYFTDMHQPAELDHLRLRRLGDCRFDVDVAVTCELEQLDGTRLPPRSIAWRGEMSFDRISIVRENLFPKPSTPGEATAVLASFLDPTDFEPPLLDEHAFVFHPICTSA